MIINWRLFRRLKTLTYYFRESLWINVCQNTLIATQLLTGKWYIPWYSLGLIISDVSLSGGVSWKQFISFLVTKLVSTASVSLFKTYQKFWLVWKHHWENWLLLFPLKPFPLNQILKSCLLRTELDVENAEAYLVQVCLFISFKKEQYNKT